MKKEYTNGEITVVWQPEVCIHSAICWRGQQGLSTVFDPRKKPWVNMNGSDSETIMKKIDQCPSGALSYFKNSESSHDPIMESETIVELSPNGPLMVYGNLTIKNANGETQRKSKITAFCRCGASQNKPYCDGSHTKIGFEG